MVTTTSSVLEWQFIHYCYKDVQGKYKEHDQDYRNIWFLLQFVDTQSNFSQNRSRIMKTHTKDYMRSYDPFVCNFLITYRGEIPSKPKEYREMEQNFTSTLPF
jgi:hypothetical protein